MARTTSVSGWFHSEHHRTVRNVIPAGIDLRHGCCCAAIWTTHAAKSGQHRLSDLYHNKIMCADLPTHISELQRLYASFTLSSTGWKTAVAFFISVAGSAPPTMLVRPTPMVSRNSVTGTITGRPDRASFRLVPVVSNHSCGRRWSSPNPLAYSRTVAPACRNQNETARSGCPCW